jgi:histidinol-phosphatase (PHP family)
MPDPILYDSHMHTPLCKHATGEPEAYAAQAEKRGLRGIVITCHNPYPGNTYDFRWRMRDDQVDEYLALVRRAQVTWVGRIDVRLGMECDYFPGHEPWLAELTARADFDFLLGSVHPDTVEYKAAFNGAGAVALQRSYFGHLADAAESGLFDCLSHPDLVKNETHDEWDVERVLDDIRAALDRIAQTGVAMELNTSGLHKRVKEMCPGPVILAEMATRGIPVVLGSDSHGPERVAADFETALDMLADAGHPCVYAYQGRQRQAVPIAAARASLIAP